MKKYGKFERRPEPEAAAKSPAKKTDKGPEVKSMLLQTYFTSLLCLVLCVTMFFGTSYAWFTSEVSNTANEIYVGTLKVGLYKVENGNRQDLASSDVNAAKLFDGNIRWEPGYTALETIEIVNEGDLAFTYMLSFVDGTLAQSEALELGDVAECFEMWVYDYYANGNQTPTPPSYAAITPENGWERVGTLAEVLDGTPVLENKKMVTVRQEGQDAAVINAGTTDGVATADKYAIALHMKESVDASVMGQSIALNVKLVAYQMAGEYDGFGQNTYDNEIVTVSDLEELKVALEAEEKALLLSDIAVGAEADCLTMTDGVLDGNGNTIVYSGSKNANGNSVGVVTTSGGMVQNLDIEGSENGRALYVTALDSDLTVDGCTLSGAYAFNVNSAKVTGKTMTFTDTVFESWVSYANVMDQASFTDCIFKDNLKPYGDTILSGCEFEGETLDVSALQSGEKITLINCEYNGKLVENAILTASGGTVLVEGCDTLCVSSEKMVSWNSENG